MGRQSNIACKAHILRVPRPFQHSSPPPCLQQPYFFDVVTKTIDVIKNSPQIHAHMLGLKFLLGRTLVLVPTHAYMYD